MKLLHKNPRAPGTCFNDSGCDRMSDPIKILIVEDDSDTRSNLRDILQLDGYEVAVAASGKEALEQACEQTAMAIVDRKLPDMTAEALLPELKAAMPEADVMIVTAFGDMNSSIEALRWGAVDYILKPVNPEVIRDRLKKATAHWRTAHQLKQERHFAEKILETADAIVLVLSLSGIVERFNPFFTEVSGWSLEEARGKNWFDTFVPSEDREWVREVFLATIEDERTDGILNAVISRDGRRHQIRWSNSTLRDTGGEANAVLAVGIVITDLLLAQEKAVQAERLAAVGKTMAALAHESRNALQRMRATVDMLGVLLEDNETVQKDLRALDRATADLTALHDEVRSFAAPLQLNRETAELPDAWREAWTNLASLREGRDCTLTEELADIDRQVHVDVRRFKQVFRNLIENSLAACDDPVRVHISCSALGPDAIRITFRDNGPGLTDEQRNKIFSPFYTTKSSGTGLGMAIVQRIVEAHGGQIKVALKESLFSSPWRGGAAFHIQMPLKHIISSASIRDRR